MQKYFNLLVKGKEVSDKKQPEKIDQVKPLNPKNNNNLLTRNLDFETLDIKGIQIMTMSEEELEKISVVNVKRFDEKKEKKLNLIGSISDPRMYPSKHSLCSTCFLQDIYCPGHLGRINLVKPIINIWFIKYVVSILESICQECGTLLLNIETVKRFTKGPERLKKIADASKNLPCRNKLCSKYNQANAPFDKKMDNMLKIQINYPDKKMGYITSSKILNLFKSLSDEELEALGYPQDNEYNVHPKNMIFTYLPVIPENHRPTTKEDGELKHNILTQIYWKIIEVNNSLKNGIKDPKMTLDNLENYIGSIIFRDQDVSKTGNPGINPSQSDRYKNVHEILGKKKGLIRLNAQGKRTDKTGRSVIGPGGLNVPFGWIKLPKVMEKITVHERVCNHNIKHFEKLLEEGKISSIVTSSKNIRAEFRHKDFVLRNGMIVKRHLQDGDPIIFNRNPTLHKHSMMGYIVKFGEGMTIGLHSSNTTPHNADFDGDEGNLYCPPDYKSRAEIIHLVSCWSNVIGSQFSRPMMGLVYNTITSAYLMSQYGVIKDKTWDMFINNVFTRSSRIKTLEERAKRRRNDSNWKTGPVLFSALLPETLYYSYGGVVIQEGILIKGKLTKKHVGPSVKSLIHMIYFNYGDQTCAQFISEGQNLLDMFIEYIGFTVGYRDCSMPDEEKQVKEIVKREIEEAEKTLQNRSVLVGNKNPEIQKFYIDSVKASLDKIKTIGQQIIEEALDSSNSLKIMADSGAKGKETDIAQVIGIVGQQFVKGDRPAMIFNIEPEIMNTGLRFLPYYDILHLGRKEKITSRGFVDRPLGKGMRPGQFFSHMMASRIGLIDTAFGTALTGYSQHTITKALEDMRYAYNGTICEDLGQIVQYAGGEDSYEPMEMIEVKIPGFGNVWSPIDINSLVDMLNNE